ncbi:hypothetical protein HDV01_001052 [Terramyces sp. JEL0728]|nr:hypothetical protein HDV01_001052 [Terramyces sp. JEL0728]
MWYYFLPLLIVFIPLTRKSKTHSLFISTTFHKRFLPKQHQFKYPVIYFGLDLDCNDLPYLFSFNRFNLFSIYDSDYGVKGKSIKEGIADKLREFNIGGVEKIFMVTTPRFLGIGFNPLNVFYCYKGSELVVLLEVNNTFRDREWYICDSTFAFKKSMHVSPFNDMQGEYHCTVTEPNEKMDVLLELVKDGLWLIARVNGVAYEFNSLNLLITFITFPFTLVSTFFRICYEAFFIYRKLKMYYKNPKIK